MLYNATTLTCLACLLLDVVFLYLFWFVCSFVCSFICRETTYYPIELDIENTNEHINVLRDFKSVTW